MKNKLNKRAIKAFLGQCIERSVYLLVLLADLKDNESNELYKQTYTELTQLNKLITSLDEYMDFRRR